MPKDIRIATIGQVDSGKSTVVGVLSKGILDDGNGLSRSFVLKHQHEKLKGQTSSIGLEIIGFDNNGKHIIPNNSAGRRLKEFREVSQKSSRKVILIDLCGHKKFLKTTISGLCSLAPDYSMIILSANSGIVPKITLEHMNMSFVLNIPFFIVITKIDMAPENIYNETMKNLNDVIERYKKRKSNINIDILKISNKTGEGIENLKDYIKSLSIKSDKIIYTKNDNNNINYIIDSKYQVPGVGIVIGGYLKSGMIKENQLLLIGPNKDNNFDKVQIKSIHKYCIPIKETYENEQTTLAIKYIDIKKADKNIIRKGSRLISLNNNDLLDKHIKEFDANIKILRHSTSIKEGYESTIHMENITQTARIIKIYNNDELDNVLRLGSVGKVRFRFLNSGEIINIGTTFIFREGNCKGVGTVLNF